MFKVPLGTTWDLEMKIYSYPWEYHKRYNFTPFLLIVSNHLPMKLMWWNHNSIAANIVKIQLSIEMLLKIGTQYKIFVSNPTHRLTDVTRSSLKVQHYCIWLFAPSKIHHICHVCKKWCPLWRIRKSRLHKTGILKDNISHY